MNIHTNFSKKAELLNISIATKKRIFDRLQINNRIEGKEQMVK